MYPGTENVLKYKKFIVFLGLREYEVRSNPCLMPFCASGGQAFKCTGSSNPASDKQDSGSICT